MKSAMALLAGVLFLATATVRADDPWVDLGAKAPITSVNIFGQTVMNLGPYIWTETFDKPTFVEQVKFRTPRTCGFSALSILFQGWNTDAFGNHPVVGALGPVQDTSDTLYFSYTYQLGPTGDGATLQRIQYTYQYTGGTNCGIHAWYQGHEKADSGNDSGNGSGPIPL